MRNSLRIKSPEALEQRIAPFGMSMQIGGGLFGVVTVTNVGACVTISCPAIGGHVSIGVAPGYMGVGAG